MIEGIDHIHINVRNRNKSELWYRDILGLVRVPSLEFWAADGGPLTLANSNESVHLALFENSEIQSTTVAFKVSASGLQNSISHLRNNGIEVRPVNHDISWSIYFKDPDGNPYEITTYDYDEFASNV